jgi:hypothetical protein
VRLYCKGKLKLDLLELPPAESKQWEYVSVEKDAQLIGLTETNFVLPFRAVTESYSTSFGFFNLAPRSPKIVYCPLGCTNCYSKLRPVDFQLIENQFGEDSNI